MNYLRTDEESEASAALGMAARMSSDIIQDVSAWRWVILALHNSLQGFMVLSLRHGNGLLALSPRCFSAWMDAHEKGGKYPADELDTYLNLYKKIKNKSTGSTGGNKPFSPTGSQGRSIRKLNSLRNEFIHFTPKGWSLEVSGLPQIGMDCAALIAFLGWETDNIFWHDTSAREKAKESHAKFIENLQIIEAKYLEVRS